MAEYVAFTAVKVTVSDEDAQWALSKDVFEELLDHATHLAFGGSEADLVYCTYTGDEGYTWGWLTSETIAFYPDAKVQRTVKVQWSRPEIVGGIKR